MSVQPRYAFVSLHVLANRPNTVANYSNRSPVRPELICRVDPRRKFCSLESYRGLGKARGTAACAGGALAESFNTDSDCVARVFDDHCGHIHIGPFAAGGILRAPFR
jgi:hypothetical protein